MANPNVELQAYGRYFISTRTYHKFFQAVKLYCPHANLDALRRALPTEKLLTKSQLRKALTKALAAQQQPNDADIVNGIIRGLG